MKPEIQIHPMDPVIFHDVENMKKEIRIHPSDNGVVRLEREKFIWVTDKETDIVFYQDAKVATENKRGKVKIAWVFEPEEINPITYHHMRHNWREFDYIFTWDKELCRIDSRFIFVPYGSAYINVPYYEIYEKTKNVSIVASAKRFMPGHNMRHAVIERYKGRMDLYGRGYNPIDNLLDAFKDYRFTIVIENTNKDCNLTEKFVSPVLCGTVPIFWGCPSAGEIFDSRGFISFTKIEELEKILPTLTEEKYQEMLPYVQANFETAKKYTLIDNTVYDKMVELGIIVP